MSIRISGMVSGMDTDAMVRDLVNVQRLKNKKVSDQKTLLTWKQDKWKDLNAKLYKLYTQDLAKLKTQSNYMTKSVAVSNDTLLSATAGINAPIGAHTIEVKQLASAQYVTSDIVEATNNTKLSDLGITSGSSFRFGNKEYTVNDNSTIRDLVSSMKEAGLNASYDETNKRFFLSSKDSGVGFELEASDPELLKKIGLNTIKDNNGELIVSEDANVEMVYVKASKSKIIYNNLEITGNSNSITVNGLTVNLKGSKEGEKVTLTVSNDTQATYNAIKNFVKSYNSILDEMNKLYYADSSKGYNPLSDEEKEAMTDDQVEKWETKIKDSILRKDSTLNSIITSMKSILSESVSIKVGEQDKSYSMSSFGIMTSPNYMERGLLHIYGDEEDTTYALKEDKLLKAITEDPELVMEVFTKIGDKLYKDMADKMKSVPNVSSALTFYNDKLMDKKQSEYDEEIAKLEARLLALEDKYYKQFSAMETALAKLQSQSNSLLSMLGNSSR